MSERDWADQAIRKIEADFTRSADTHLERLDLPGLGGIVLYLKDESTHPTGSLKHRLARSLFLYGLCNGWIREGSTVIDASSGSTAISEAYFARLLGLRFVAVMPKTTSPDPTWAPCSRGSSSINSPACATGTATSTRISRSLRKSERSFSREIR